MAAIIGLLILLYSFQVGQAQDSSCYSHIRCGLMAGRIIENHPGFPDVDNLSAGAELSFGKKLCGKKAWHKSYGYGEVSVSFTFSSMGNSDVLGNYLSVIPELIIPWKDFGRWKTSVTLGLGGAWFSKPFDKVHNRDNIVIGSAFTFCATAAFNATYRINDVWYLFLGPKIYHASNSHSNLPNAGMNLPVMMAGARYDFSNQNGKFDTSPIHEWDKRLRISLRAGLGYNQFGGTTGPGGPHYPIYLLSVFVTKKVSLVNKLQTGIEGWYNTGVYDFILSQDFYDEKQRLRSYSLIWFAGHEFLLGHISLVTQGGVYLYNPFFRDKLSRQTSASLKEKLKTHFPARIGLQYYLYDETERKAGNFYIGIYIKTNLGQADFFDSGIGFRF